MNRPPDVEATFVFNGSRKTPASNGYRPGHLVQHDDLTTGVHQYFGVETVAPDGTAHGTITFIAPEAYPACLWVGKVINIQEGAKVVGTATITQIFNAVLKRDADS